MSTISLKLPESLYRKVKELSKRENISINHFISIALSEKISALLAEEYIEQRAAKASKEKYNNAISKVPNTEPEEYDKL